MVSVQGVSVQEGGLCPRTVSVGGGVSVRGYLSGWSVSKWVPDRGPPPLYGYVRAVCILLACILVKIVQFLESAGRIED